MKIVEIFSRPLKSSRQLLFKNIFDLDHVCVVHRRWFSNLRPLVKQRDYLEYRLLSHFFGLKQDLLVRGRLLDADHYWYEFAGPLARISVAGVITGPDGDLVIRETITYHFTWILTPLFWLLQPVFRRQKENILDDDFALLEREYALEQTGFQRLEPPANPPLVVVFGGNGFFGRLVVEDLLQQTGANVLIVSRQLGRSSFPPFESRIRFAACDINDLAATCAIIEGAAVAIGCVGPFQGQTLNLLRACIEKRVHYVDMADDRDFVQRAHELRSEIEQAGILAFVGCSVVPGISLLLANYCRSSQLPLESVRICISPGTRSPRGPGSFLCLLATVGQEYRIPRRDGAQVIRGWTGRESVVFPAPMGQRWVYHIVDIADYYLQPAQTGASQVDFKIGSELDLMNRCLSAFRWFRERVGVKRLAAWVPLFRLVIKLVSVFGTSCGGVMVEVDGPAGRRGRCALAGRGGHIIPAILPALATGMILSGEVCHVGLVPLAGWLPESRLRAELKRRQIVYATTEGAHEWKAPD